MPQIMENPEQEQEQDKTYHKSIDALIEDAEIEAEIEAEKTIRSKNARLLTISLVGIALIAFIYWQVTGATSSKDNAEVALPELTEAPPVENLSKETPVAESGLEPVVEPVPAADPAPISDPTPAPVASENPEPQIAEPAKVELEVANAIPAAPVEKQLEPVTAKAPPVEPTLQPVMKTPAVVSQPAKTSLPATPAVKKYFVQLGLFSIEENAKGLAKRIKSKGFKPSIQAKNVEAERYVVFIGGFSTEESGSQALNDLKAKGFNSAMEKLADNSYTIVVGKFITSPQAETLRDKLSYEGFLSSTRKSKVASDTYIVQLGAFDSLPQAKGAQKKIGRAGFNDSFIR